MRALEVKKSTNGCGYLAIRVEHRFLGITWVSDYRGSPTLFDGIWAWSERIRGTSVKGSMAVFLDGEARKLS